MKQKFNRIFLVLTGIFLTLILVGCDQGTNEKKQFFTEENSEEGSVEPQSINLKEEVVEEQFSEATVEESGVEELQGIIVWNEEVGNRVWYPTEKSWLDSAGFTDTEPYYEYTNPEAGVQAVLYYNEALERGCVIISEDGRTPLYAFLETEDKLWEGERDYDRFATLGEVGGDTGQDMVDRDFQEHYEYDEEGRTIHYSSTGIVEWFSGEPEEWAVLEISWEYDDRGKLRKYTYFHNPNIFGTWYHWLTSWLDEWERTEYERYYVTHGVHTSFYIYSDDSSNPKYHLLICPGCGSYKLSRHRT